MSGIYAEIIFETGSKSVAYYETEDEMNKALAAHNARAVAGEDGGPTGHPAERIKKVLTYDKHPGTLNESQSISTDVAKTELAAAMKSLDQEGAVSVQEMAAAVRDLSSPMVIDAGRHDSMYKMPETGEVDPSVWEAAA